MLVDKLLAMRLIGGFILEVFIARAAMHFFGVRVRSHVSNKTMVFVELLARWTRQKIFATFVSFADMTPQTARTFITLVATSPSALVGLKIFIIA